MKRIFAVLCLILVLASAFTLPVYAAENTFTTTEFFNDKVLPLLISAVCTLFAGLLVIAPALKASGKFKQIAAVYNKLKEENATLAKLLESTDVAQFKSALEELLTDDLKKAIANIHIDNAALAELRTQYDGLTERVQALINAATNVWAQNPGAVACLTNAPDASALRAANEKIAALEAYIRAEKGEEAERIIAETEGV